MNYCLNKKKLRQLILFKVLGSEIEDDELNAMIQGAECWDCCLVAITYLFSTILEKRNKFMNDGVDLIESFYNLENQIFFDIQELDSEFVNCMVRNSSDTDLTLEEQLISLLEKLSDHDYNQTLRYRY